MRTDEPIADFKRHDAEQQAQLEKLPVCEICKEPIQQEKAIYYNDQWCCDECSNEFWDSIKEDFMERVCEDD